jgi:hypothetical protein
MTDEKDEGKFHEIMGHNELFQGVISSIKKDLEDVSKLEEEEEEIAHGMKHHEGKHGGHKEAHKEKETDEGNDVDEEGNNRDKTIMRVSSKFRLRWDIYIIIAAIYNTITIPLDIAFKPAILGSIGITVMESFIDLSFFIDIFINFRTTYISSKTGEEIYDPKLIAKRYILGGRFFLDFLSSIPFDKLSGGSNDILPMLGMLKLFRISRINVVIRNLNTKSDFKAFLKVLWLVFFLFLYNHVIACLWYYIIIVKEVYIP